MALALQGAAGFSPLVIAALDHSQVWAPHCNQGRGTASQLRLGSPSRLRSLVPITPAAPRRHQHPGFTPAASCRVTMGDPPASCSHAYPWRGVPQITCTPMSLPGTFKAQFPSAGTQSLSAPLSRQGGDKAACWGAWGVTSSPTVTPMSPPAITPMGPCWGNATASSRLP